MPVNQISSCLKRPQSTVMHPAGTNARAQGRHGHCSDLDFTNEERHENIRRIGGNNQTLADAGGIVLVALHSPFSADRDRVRQVTGADFIEIYCNWQAEVFEACDIKPLYKKARLEISEFTGISSP